MSANLYLHNICCAAGDRGKQLKSGSPVAGRAAAESREKTFFILEAARFWPHALRKQKAGLLIRSWRAWHQTAKNPPHRWSGSFSFFTELRR